MIIVAHCCNFDKGKHFRDGGAGETDGLRDTESCGCRNSTLLPFVKGFHVRLSHTLRNGKKRRNMNLMHARWRETTGVQFFWASPRAVTTYKIDVIARILGRLSGTVGNGHFRWWVYKVVELSQSHIFGRFLTRTVPTVVLGHKS